ncbi:MAG: DUF6089 family protein [Saprospiraceae bacterium]
MNNLFFLPTAARGWVGYLVLLGVLLGPVSGRAQQMLGWEVGPWAGAALYLGDLNTDFSFRRIQPAGGLSARYNFNDRLSAKISANYGRLLAMDSDSNNPFEKTRNLSFQSDVFDGTAQFEFNFLPYIHGDFERWMTPYAFAGISVFNYNPMARAADGELYELRALGTEGQLKGEEYLPTSGALTYGLGFKLDLSYEWSLDFHIGARNTFTDYLDDVSTVYADQSDLRRSRGDIAVELADRSIFSDGSPNRDREGEQRGDSTGKDKYIFMGVGLHYYFGDIRCPTYGGRKRR